MSGPYGNALREMQGPIVGWESQRFAVPASGVLQEAFHMQGQYGYVVPYLRNVIAANGYETDDILLRVPNLVQPVGSPGGGGGIAINPRRVGLFVSQGLFHIPKGGGGAIDLGGSANYALQFRGLFPQGPGPYPILTKNFGPLISGKSQEFDYPTTLSSNLFVRNPSGYTPFLYTLYARNVSTDLGYNPGTVIACFPANGATTVRGWGVSYDDQSRSFVISVHNSSSAINFVNASGASAAIDPTKWKFFFRFVAFLGSRPYDSMGKVDGGRALRMYQTQHVPLGDAVGPYTFDMTEFDHPVLVLPMLYCLSPELGYSQGDMVPWGNDDNNFAGSGFGIAMTRRNMSVIRTTSVSIHRYDATTFSALTSANWNWFLIIVG